MLVEKQELASKLLGAQGVDIPQGCETLEDFLVHLHYALQRRYSSMRGRTRACYDIPGEYVLKVPLNDMGCWDNQSEARTYQKAQGSSDTRGPFYAKCKLDYIWDIPVLLMERVTLPQSLEALPDWTSWVDCRQVGYTSAGDLVAYDYA